MHEPPIFKLVHFFFLLYAFQIQILNFKKRGFSATSILFFAFFYSKHFEL